MNKDRRAVVIHDMATLAFLVPFSTLTLVEVFFGYVVYPMFLTHALTFHMLYDLAWIYVQPRIITSHRNLIMLHHVVALLYLHLVFISPRLSVG